MKIRALVLALAIALFTYAPHAVARTPVAVMQCGQVLTGDGFLTGDLDCSAQSTGAASVVLMKPGRLALGSFTITGSTSPAVPETIRCESRCIIEGPGTISGGEYGIVARSGRSGRVDANDITVTGAVFGILAPKVHVRQVTVTGNSLEGIRSSKAKITDSQITNNGGMGPGVRGDVVKLTAATITGNGAAGVEGGKLTAKDSTITGNGTDASCGVTAVCADLSLERRPHLKNTTCGTSLDKRACSCSVGDASGPGTDPATHNFGVCSSD